MRNLKRALSLAVASVMLLGMMVVGTGAAGYSDVSSEDNQEAIEVLQAVSIMSGDDQGNFNPDKSVTRAEMAVIMTKVLDLNTGNYSVSAMPFTDVPAWAQSYVAAIYAEGVTGGISETEYGTDYPITAAQAALMLMKALGYFQYQSDLADGWLLATIRQAGRIDLFEGIDAGAEDALTRNEVAQLVLNTLEATMVEPTGSQGVQIGDVVVGSTIKYEEISKTTDGKYDKIANDPAESGKCYVQLGEELFDGKLVKDTSATNADDMGRPGTKWSYNGPEIGTYANEADYTFVVNSTSGARAKMDYWLEELNDDFSNLGTALKDSTGSANDSKVHTNGAQYKGTSNYVPKVGDQVEVFVSESDANVVTAVVITQYKLAKIDEVDTDVNSTDAKNDVTAYLTLKDAKGNNIDTFKNTDVAGYNAATYVEDAYIAYALNGTKILDSYVVTPAAEGQITAYKANDSYTMGGTAYKAVTTSMFVEDYTEDDFTGTYALYTDKNGLLIGIVEIDAGAVASDAVFVTGTWSKTGANEFGEDVITYYAQIVDMDGAASTVVTGYTTEKGEIFGVDNSGKKYTEATVTAAGDIEATHYYLKKDGSGAISIASCTADTIPTDAIGYVAEGDDAAKMAGINFYTATASAIATNGLYTTEDSDDDYVEFTALATEGNRQVTTSQTVSGLKTDSNRVNANGAYITDSTVFIVVEGSLSSIDVSVRTGGINFGNSTSNAAVIANKVGTSYEAQYVILPITSDWTSGVLSDMVYVDSNSMTNVDGGKELAVYNADGEELTIKVSSSASVDKNSFYTYTVNSSNVYTLTKVDFDDLLATGNIAWDDQTGVDEGYFLSAYGDQITIGNAATGATEKLVDIDAANAVIVDVHETDNDDFQSEAGNSSKDTYAGTVSSIEALASRVDAGYDVKIQLSVDGDGVVLLVVTEISRTI